MPSSPPPDPSSDTAALPIHDREWFRQLVALPPGLVGLLVPGGVLLKVLALWDVVAVVYLVLSYRTYRTSDPATLRALARPRRDSLPDRILASPPQQFPASAAVLALITTVLVIPQVHQPPAASTLTLGVCLIAVLSAWIMIQFGFAVGYLTEFAERGGLQFPGDDLPIMADFLYFSVAVGTSFGTTDVVVSSREMRRRVLKHSLLAFLFNTTILASAVALASTFLVPAAP